MSSQSVVLCASYKTLYPRLYNLCLGLEYLISSEKAHRNPGALRRTGVELDGMIVESGANQEIVFETYHDGLFAFLHDMWARCDGRTSTGLTRMSALEDFVKVFLEERNITELDEFMQDLLNLIDGTNGVIGDCGFERDTKMRFFLE